MKAADWIDRVKTARGWDSDYRVAKELGLSRTTISMLRSKASTLDEDTSIKVAAALGERPELVLVDQAAERSKNDDVRTALGRVLALIGGGCHPPGKSVNRKAAGPASERLNITKSASVDDLYIVSNGARQFLRSLFTLAPSLSPA